MDISTIDGNPSSVVFSTEVQLHVKYMLLKWLHIIAESFQSHPLGVS